MIIEGKKNLEFLKRALLSYRRVSCSIKAKIDDKISLDFWDTEIADGIIMLDAVEINLREFREEEETPWPAATPPEGRHTDSFQ